MEEEFIRNQETLKPQEEKQEVRQTNFFSGYIYHLAKKILRMLVFLIMWSLYSLLAYIINKQA